MLFKYEILYNPKTQMYQTTLFEFMSFSRLEREYAAALKDGDYFLMQDRARMTPNTWEFVSSTHDYYAELPPAYRKKWLNAGKPTIFYIVTESYLRLNREPKAWLDCRTPRWNRHDWKRLYRTRLNKKVARY